MTDGNMSIASHLLEFAQLVQNSNMSNCHHNSQKIIRETNRFIATRSKAMRAPVLMCEKSTQLAEMIMHLRNVESGTGDEVRIKRKCLEILVAMKSIDESGFAPDACKKTNKIVPLEKTG